MHTAPYDSIIPCFGSRLTVLTLPDVRQYRIHPLGTFHYFDWQKTDNVGISIGTCPQIVTSTTARIGVTLDGGETRLFPFADGDIFSDITQTITPLTTQLTAHEPALGLTVTLTFRSLFYPQNFQFSAAPGYMIDVAVTLANGGRASAFFALPLANPTLENGHIRAIEPLVFPDGIDHTGIDGLTFEQVIAGGSVSLDDGYARVAQALQLRPNETQTAVFYHAGYIAQPTLNVRGDLHRFGYTDLWKNAQDVVRFLQTNQAEISENGRFFEATILDATLPPAQKQLMAASFKGLASNAWWGERDWFSIMEIGAYHSTLDVDYQLCLFFFQYWIELVRPMLDQWADFYEWDSGYMAHDVGQHLEALGNRYGSPGSAMKVEENCNYILLLHHYWRWSADHTAVTDHLPLVRELVAFLLAADTTGSGLPNQFCDNTNDWGSALITNSEEQSYHGVRMIMAFSAVAQMADFVDDNAYAEQCRAHADLINRSLEKGWLGDHYPISLADPASFNHYSMWTTHGLLYPMRSGLDTPIDMGKLTIDLISSTARTLREHGCVHSSADVRGWQTQNLWRDCIAAYLGVDHTHLLNRYLGHGEYVSYEDTTILEVANELMVVPGASAAHTHAGQTHPVPMVDGHPRPACIFGLPYALAGVQFDAITGELTAAPTHFPLTIPLTHTADWANRTIETLTCTRSIPNQDAGHRAAVIETTIETGEIP